MNNIKKFLSTFADSVHVASIGIDSVVVWLKSEFDKGEVKFSNNLVVDSFEDLPAYRAEIQDIMRPLFVDRMIDAEMVKLKDAILISDSDTTKIEELLGQQFYMEIGASKKYNFSSSDTKELEKFISWVKGRLVWYLNADARNNKDKSKAIRAIKGWFASKVSKSMATLNTILGKKKKGGSLKSVPSDNKGLGKLPEGVRNKMGYKKMGGKMKSKMSYMKAGGPVEQFD